MDFELHSNGITNVECCHDSREVIPKLKEIKYSVIFFDLDMPYINGYELLWNIITDYPDIPIIVITGCIEEETARDCMEMGAFEYLTKPIDKGELIRTIHETLDLKDTHKDIILHKKKLFSDTSYKNRSFPNVITRSKDMLSICQTIGLVAFTSRPVLIMGDTGVGKEFLAREIHSQSHRRGKFILFDTTGLDDDGFASNIFGYRTTIAHGAAALIEGKLEEARNGTLFIKEIGNISLESQAKLLRVLRDREYYPVGSNTLKSSRARIVAGTSKNLSALIQIGSFRYDLYNHLKVHEIHIPPLRERKEDIPLLVDHFLAEEAVKAGIKKPTVPRDLFPLLEKYDFLGNVGELKAMVYKAVIRCKSDTLPTDIFLINMKKNEDKT